MMASAIIKVTGKAAAADDSTTSIAGTADVATNAISIASTRASIKVSMKASMTATIMAAARLAVKT